MRRKLKSYTPPSTRRNSQSSQSSGTSVLSNLIFVLNSPAIPEEGVLEDPMDDVENTLNQDTTPRLTCAKCSEEITADFPKDTVFLSCKHAVHYDCIDNPHKKCPTCPGEVLESIPEEEASSTAQRKRTSDLSESTRQSSSKKQKTSTNDEESPTLKRLIRELKMPSSASTDTQHPIAKTGSLTELYEAIITAEDKNRATNQEIIKKYYSFGEELEKIFDRFKSSYRDRKAQRLLVKEVTKQLPGDLSKNAIEKRIERGRKVYDLFSDIGYDKIQLIKSFSASQIYKLSWDVIDAIEAEFE